MPKVAESTVRRLSLYLRSLEELAERGVLRVSSEQLAARGLTTSAQVRKDLSFFGSFGKRGFGYSVMELAGKLREILGLESVYRVAVIGAGKIGNALSQYRGFVQRGFHIVSMYDTDPAKIGSLAGGLRVRDLARLEQDCRADPVDIGIIVTPVDAAQSVADQLVRAGVHAILNFAPVRLSVPPEVIVKNVNMAIELESLSYALRNR
jgi:redox-sensing transcriptional repressor